LVRLGSGVAFGLNVVVGRVHNTGDDCDAFADWLDRFDFACLLYAYLTTAPFFFFAEAEYGLMLWLFVSLLPTLVLRACKRWIWQKRN